MTTSLPFLNKLALLDDKKYRQKAVHSFFTAVMSELTHIYGQADAKHIKHIRQRKKESMIQLRSLMHLALQDIVDSTASTVDVRAMDLYPFAKAEQLVRQASIQVWGTTEVLSQRCARAGLVSLHRKLLKNWEALLESQSEEVASQLQDLKSKLINWESTEVAVWGSLVGCLALKLFHPTIRVVAPTLSASVSKEMDCIKLKMAQLSYLYALQGEALSLEETTGFTSWLKTQVAVAPAKDV